MIGSRFVPLLAALALSSGALLPACAARTPAPAAPAHPDAMAELLDYARSQNTTGFLIIRDGKTITEQNWAPPENNAQFALFLYGRAGDGSLLEDVASQQKSFVAVLVAIAQDKGLIDIDKPVSAYLGKGWSKATPEQEGRIRVIDLLTMSSGLADDFTFQADAGTLFHYNTPVYAITKRVLAAAAGQPLETLTHDWLTAPAGMNDTAWRKRPAALASIGNDTGLVTTPRDTARFGQMVMHGGVSADGRRIVSEARLKALFTRSVTNPAYGRLWWLNGSAYAIRAVGGRVEGQLIPAGPTDMIVALGAFDRKLYIVPSMKLIVVRTGAAAHDKDFDQQLWLRLTKVLS